MMQRPKPNGLTGFEALKSAFARHGHTFVQSGRGDGFVALRWGFAKHLPTERHALAFLKKIGG
jgi:hypothetical protein